MNEMTVDAARAQAPAAMVAGLSVLRGPFRPDLLRDEVLADLIAATAKTCGVQRALVGTDRTLTYAELEAEANRLAQGLIEAGIGPGDVVGLWMPRGVDLLVAQVAITKSGAARLPFDADAPIERIAVCLDDCDAEGLLCNEAFRARAQSFYESHAAQHPPRTVWADTMLGARDEVAHVDPRARGLTPDHPAYLIYTSGSTGTPKESSSAIATSATSCAPGTRSTVSPARMWCSRALPSRSICRWRRSGSPISSARR